MSIPTDNYNGSSLWETVELPFADYLFIIIFIAEMPFTKLKCINYFSRS